MERRIKIFLLCLWTSLFTLVIWKTTNISDSVTFPHNFIVNKINSVNTQKLWQIGKYFYSKNNKTSQDSSDNYESFENKTIILMWTKYYKVSDAALLGSIKSGRKYDPDCCTGNDLIVTLDRSLLANATVVVFYNYYDNLKRKDLPRSRPSGQLWVLFSKESPAYSLPLHQFPDTFNWTMSYRRDSDIWSPYGFYKPLDNPISLNDTILMPENASLPEWIQNKSGILAGVISHCPTRSKRLRLIQRLRKSSLGVDVFGACGNRSICPRTSKTCNHAKFWRDLSAKYKFYFAGENSICVDYITEKFWRTLEQGMVPLVYGGGNYTAVAPPNSFIDALKFKSPKEVADYLKVLDNNPDEYAKYFEWKRKYKVVLTDGWGGWCTLCRLARQYKNNPDSMEISPNKSYKNLANWWIREKIGSKNSACKKPLFNL